VKRKGLPRFTRGRWRRYESPPPAAGKLSGFARRDAPRTWRGEAHLCRRRPPVVHCDEVLLPGPAGSGGDLYEIRRLTRRRNLPYTIPFPPVLGGVSSGRCLWTGPPSTNRYACGPSPGQGFRVPIPGGVYALRAGHDYRVPSPQLSKRFPQKNFPGRGQFSRFMAI